MSASRPIRLPGPSAGLAIGLLGGSFDPPHAGHAHVIETARRHVGLDWVWVLPALGNPLKTTSTPFEARLERAGSTLRAPRVLVSDLERQLGLRYTIDLIAALKQRAPLAHFVWLMGGDNLNDFHRWRRWRDIATACPIAVVSRPDAFPSAGLSRFSRQFASARLPQSAARALPYAAPPAWTLINAPLDPHTSTALRTSRG